MRHGSSNRAEISCIKPEPSHIRRLLRNRVRIYWSEGTEETVFGGVVVEATTTRDARNNILEDHAVA